MKLKSLILAPVLLATIGMCCSCSPKEEAAEPNSVRMIKSEIIRMPEAWMIDFNKKLKWNYTHGLELQSFMEAAKQYPQIESLVYDYAGAYLDTIINPEGQIQVYKLTNFTLDHINAGKILFYAYDRTNDPRFKTAMDTLYKQLTLHPRVAEGGFWHKKVYPHQMWLDGIYMEAPFYAEYAKRFLEGDAQKAAYDDIVKQFTVIARHTYDPANGLYRHAWDESKEQQWADKTTGQSAHVWGRALGWYAMALVDVLAFLPEDYSGRDSLLQILNPLAASIRKIQDPETGAWYQVMDQSGREGNYLETTCTAMFAYTFFKGALNGYLPREYWDYGYQAYDGLNKNFIREDQDGTISLTRCCAVAGLGGKPYRDGTYEYYINETIRDNDPKGVGPYIMAALFVEKYGQDMKKD